MRVQLDLRVMVSNDAVLCDLKSHSRFELVNF